MNKKLIFIFSLMFLIGIDSSAIASDSEWAVVRTVDEFFDAFDKHQNIALKADLDFTGRHFSPSYGQFTSLDYSGEICGIKEQYNPETESPYYAIQNLTDRVAGKIYNIKLHHLVFKGVSSELFDVTNDCEFSELFFERCGMREGKKTTIAALISNEDYKSTMKNIIVLGSNIYLDGAKAGFLSGTMSGTVVENCMVTASCTVYAQGGKVGSLAGYTTQGAKITNCSSYATVIGYEDSCGGLVGKAEQGTSIENCHFFGLIKQTEISQEEFQTGVISGQAIFAELMSKLYTGVDAAYTAYSYTVNAMASMKTFATLAAFTVEDLMEGINMLKANGNFFVSLLINNTEAVYYTISYFQMACAFNTVMVIWSIVSLVKKFIVMVYDLNASDEVGGIVGICDQTFIRHCANYGMVYSLDAYAGGIVGYATQSEVIDCLNHGAVHGDEQTGGIAGYMGGGSIIKTCLNIGNISCRDTSTAGRICGEMKDTESSYNCYSDYESDLDNEDKRDGLRVSQLDLVSGRAAAFLNERSGHDRLFWHQSVGQDHWPTLESTHPKATEENINTSLSTVVEVIDKSTLVAAMVNPFSDITLMADIDCEGSPAFCLSSEYMPYRGVFNGNGHRISNIRYHADGKTPTLLGLQSLWMNSKNIAILGCAVGATFRDLELSDIILEQDADIENAALLVAHSKNCIYDNIHITGHSSNTHYPGNFPRVWNVGGIIGYSEGDQIMNCSTGPNCYFYSYGSKLNDAKLGGIAGVANGSTISHCWNAATVDSGDDVVGGILGLSMGACVTDCVNTGSVRAYEHVGGLVGQLRGSSSIIHSVCNAEVIAYGLLYMGDFTYSSRTGMLVGTVAEGTSMIRGCLALGKLINSQSKDGLVGLVEKGGSVQSEGSTYWHYTYKQAGESPIVRDDLGYLFNWKDKEKDAIIFPSNEEVEEAIISGRLTNRIAELDDWYQLIDGKDQLMIQGVNHDFPMPFAEVGSVMTNTLCNGNLSYSNLFNSANGHSYSDHYGICSTCGNIGPAQAEPYEIANTADFQAFARSVLKGNSNISATLTADIDFDGVDFQEIGTAEHPYRGTFDGGGHRILHAQGHKGVFGVVAAGAVIRDLTVSGSCRFTTASNYAGGLVGQTLDEETETPITIERCGNEAYVQSYSGAGGILGHQGSTDWGKCAPVKIRDCYNRGSINGVYNVSGLCGWGRKSLTVEHSWSHGSLQGHTSGYLLVCYPARNEVPTLSACYVSQKYGSDYLARGASDLDFLAGEVCNRVDEGRGVWGQSLGVDNFPVFSDQGIRHEREMGESEWGTVILPFDVSSNEEVHYFKVVSLGSDDGNHQMELQPVDVVKNNTPAFFKKLHPEQTKITFRPGDRPLIFVDILDFAYQAEQTPEATFYGTYTKLIRKDIVYSDPSAVKYTTATTEIPACQAYLTYSGSINFADGDVITLVDLDPDASHLHSFSISKASGYRHQLTCDCGYTEYEDCYCTKYDGKGQGECCACGQHVPQPAVLTDNLCTITNPGQLCWFALEVNKGQDYDAILTADIDFTGVDLPWVPIGTYREAFEDYLDENGDINYLDDGQMVSDIVPDMFVQGYSGTFDGQGHIISHIEYDGGKHYPGHGLFGFINQGTVKNVGLTQSEFKGYDYVASFVGNVQDAHIYNIYSTANVLSAVARGFHGGIGAHITRTEVINGFYAGTLENNGLTDDISLGPCYVACNVSGFYTNIKSVREREPQYLDDIRFRLGDVCIRLNEQVRSHNETNAGDWCLWNQQLGEDAVPTFGTQGVHHDRTMDGDWGAVVLPYLVKSDEHIQFYKLYEKEFVLNDGMGYIAVQKVDEVAPNTPCFFKRKNNRETTLTFAYNGSFDYSSPSTVVDGRVALLGTYADMSNPTEMFYVAQGQLVSVQSRPLGSLPALSAYLVVNDACGFSALNAVDFVEVEADGSHIHQYAMSVPEADFRKNSTHLGTCQVCGLVRYLDCFAFEYDTHGFGTCITCGQTCAEPVAIWDNHCPIANPGQLYWFAAQVNNDSNNGLNATLDCDLDLSEVTMLWEPIGIYRDKYWEALAAETVEDNAELTSEILGVGYQGTFDGQGHVIRGLYYNGARRSPLHGLFGYVNGGTIRNLGIMDSEFAGYDHVGSVAGQVQNASIENFFSTAVVSAAIRTDYVGGVAGAFRGTSRLNNGFYAGQVKSKGVQVNRQTGLWDPEHPNDAYLSGGAFHSSATDVCNRYVLVSPSVEIAAGKLCQDLEVNVTTHNANEDNWAHWSQNLGSDITPVFGESGIFHSREMSSLWGTLVLPYDLSSDDVVQYYTINRVELDGDQGYLVLTEKKKVRANTPCIFKRKTSTTTLTFSCELSALDLLSINTVSDNGLTTNGTYQPLSEQTGVYYIAQDKLWYAENPVEIPAFRAYFQLNNSASASGAAARSFSLLVSEEDGANKIGEIRDGELHFYSDGKYLERGHIVIRKGGKSYDAQGQLLKY